MDEAGDLEIFHKPDPILPLQASVDAHRTKEARRPMKGLRELGGSCKSGRYQAGLNFF